MYTARISHSRCTHHRKRWDTDGQRRLHAHAARWDRADLCGAGDGDDDRLPDVAPSTSTTWRKTLSFEAGTLLDGTSGGDSTLGTMQLDTATPLSGGTSLRTAGVATSGIVQNTTATDQLYVALLVRLDATPTASGELLRLRNGGTTLATLTVKTNRQIEVRQSGAGYGLSTALTVGTVYRLGLRYTKSTSGANGILEGWLAPVDTAWTTSHRFVNATAVTIPSQVTSLVIGTPATGVLVPLTLDDVVLDTGVLPGLASGAPTRTIGYGYDGVDRLTSVAETTTVTTTTTYSYDKAGNRQASGVTFNAANQRSDLTYDLVGNVLTDGATSMTYDALNRLTTQGTTTYSSNGDGVLISQQTGTGTRRFAQDLAAPLTQILLSSGVSYVYGQDRLVELSGMGTRTW